MTNSTSGMKQESILRAHRKAVQEGWCGGPGVPVRTLPPLSLSTLDALHTRWLSGPRHSVRAQEQGNGLGQKADASHVCPQVRSPVQTLLLHISLAGGESQGLT